MWEVGGCSSPILAAVDASVVKEVKREEVVIVMLESGKELAFSRKGVFRGGKAGCRCYKASEYG